MKYRVIGWTSLSDGEYPLHEHNTACVERAIAEEIKAHGYCFGGDIHEEYCPVLNDGTKVCFSWRGWGGVMARAKGFYEPYNYMRYYMNQFIPEKERCYPEERVNDDEIEPRVSLRENFVMHLADEPFFALKSGEKKVELRLFDEKRKGVDIGDWITFVRIGHEDERVTRLVKGIDLYRNFRELYRYDVLEADHPADRLKEMGGGKMTEEEFVAAMRKYYSEEEEEREGVMAIEVGELEHTAKTYAYLCGGVLLAEEEEIEELFGETPRFRRHGYKFGVNEEYDVDLNVMVKKTIKNFIGKEERIKKFLEENMCELYIEVVLYLTKSSQEPTPILPPDEEVVEFLHKSGAKLDIDYYIV